MSTTMTVREFSLKVQSKADLHEALCRNGFYPPSLKSGMATEAYLIGVMDRTYYCPRAEEIRIRLCPRPPDKNVLLEKFTKLMHDKGLKSGLVEGKWPDKQWLLAIISTLNPEDEIFKKDYFPPPRKNNIEEQKTIQVPNAFFEGLPDSRRRVKRHALRIVGEGRAKQRVQYLKAVQKEVQRQIFEQEALAEKARDRIKDHETRRPSSRTLDVSPSRGKNDGGSSKRQQ